MDNQERHYNIKKLNILFALSAIVLLAAIVGMFADDYLRPWKVYQKKFRDLQVEQARTKLSGEQSSLKNNSEYQSILKKLESAEKAFQSKQTEIAELDKGLLKEEGLSDLDQKNYQFAKARFDSERYMFEKAQAEKSPNLAEEKKKFEDIEASLNRHKVKVEESKAKVDATQKRIQSYSADIKKLERDRSAIAKQADLLERKLKKMDVREMSTPNKIADTVRNLPIVDFLNPTYKIDQIVIEDITDDVNFMRVPKVDRCMTCHQGVLNPDFKDAPQPFRTHPNLELFLASNSAHSLDEFGCTSCHGGRGRGTDFLSTAHMPSSPAQAEDWKKKYHWERFEFTETPMYPKQYTQAGCFKCHSGEETVKGADKLKIGLNLIEKAGCYVCHNIDRYKDWPKAGPNLTHIASKVSKDWAYRWIRDPKSFRENTWMPSFFGQSNNSDPESVKITNQEIHAIVEYLFKHSVDYKSAEIPVSGDSKRGEELVASIGCLGCHVTNPSDIDRTKTTLQGLRREHGPNLVGLGTKTSKQWIYSWLKDPYRYHPTAQMPNLRLSDQEASDIAAYLSAKSDSMFLETSVPEIDESVINEIVREFLKKSTSEAEAQDQISKMRLDEKLEFAGNKIIKQYGCFSCHIIPGFETEKPIGTDLTEEGSKSVHRLDFGFVDIEHTNHAWFTQKLKNPRIFDKDRVRPFDERLRMPNFHFTDDQVEAIVTALLGFTKDKPAESVVKPRTPRNLHVEEGQKLVRQQNCQGCHTIENEGGAIQPTVKDWLIKFENKDDAAAGAVTLSFSPPSLAGEGEKVQSEWLFHFIHNPTTIRPWLKVRMPAFDLTDAQVNTLVRYFSYMDNQDFPFVSQEVGQPAPEELKAGEMLFSKNYFDCAKCHIIGNKMPEGSPDSWAPDLALAKTRLKPAWIIKWIKNPAAVMPGTKMPTFFDPGSFDTSGPDDVLKGDENEQIRVLRDYILTLATPSASQAVDPAPQENK